MINNEARNEITYEWEVEYLDGTVLKQYDDEKNEEHHFGHIDLDRLSFFTLYRRNNPQDSFSLDVKSGIMYRNDVAINEIPVAFHRVKPVFFRRVKRLFGPGVTKAVIIAYHFGWNIGKETHLIEIQEDGSYAVPIDPLTESGFKPL